MTERYSVEKYEQRFFVRDSVTGRQHGPYPSRQVANGAKLDLEEQNINPETAKRRHVRAAYRQVNDPRTELHKLKKVLGKFVPPKDWKELQNFL